jgi:hypothetical protein
MEDHQIMRRMAVEYREQAEHAEHPARRARLRGFAEYCERMAVAMEARARENKSKDGLRAKVRQGAPGE